MCEVLTVKSIYFFIEYEEWLENQK